MMYLSGAYWLVVRAGVDLVKSLVILFSPYIQIIGENKAWIFR